MGVASGRRDQLSRSLDHLGYLRTDTVEDPGSFAIRGEILDIFPPNSPHPLRMEFFDEEVEKIRFFDPETQRVIPNQFLESFKLSPAREVLFQENNVQAIRTGLKHRADHLALHRSKRDPLLSEIKEFSVPLYSDAWATWAYPDSETAWNYFPKETSIWVDQHEIGVENWNLLYKDLIRFEEKPEEWPNVFPPISENWNLKHSLLKAESNSTWNQIFPMDVLRSEKSELIQITTSPISSDLEKTIQLLRLRAKSGHQVIISSQSQLAQEKVIELFRHYQLNISAIFCRAPLSESFDWESGGLVAITDGLLLGKTFLKNKNRKKSEKNSRENWSGLNALADLSPGDLIVHFQHGIGRFEKLTRLSPDGVEQEFLSVEYRDKDRLYLPIYRLDLIQKYSGEVSPHGLDKLGSGQFEKSKERARESAQKLAFNLVEIYARRSLAQGLICEPPGEVYDKICEEFGFEATDDQRDAIDAVVSDLTSGKIMDRLICGDVGFGKTEVAIRAAALVALSGKQVMVLVPTTLLAFQHEQTFKRRLLSSGIQIESLSRFKSKKEQQETLLRLREGRIDILIGTHRLLSSDVVIRDLGLLIIDEEHRFGVTHKEKIKSLKESAHVLTLTATPIPRTLNLALTGLREISLMRTPPLARLPVRTALFQEDEQLVREALQQELTRGGQAFVLHNRVDTIYSRAKKIQEWFPESSVVIAHGQMPETELERVLVGFYERKSQILVCTTIIESGLDVPNANTLIIDRADLFGLAQLYQIRGRVGRGQNRGYAYLEVPPLQVLTEEAKKRLQVIQKFVELGSGFQIANHDLEIRGAGNIIGPEQSGQIADVGFDLYLELLDEAIAQIQSQKTGQENENRRSHFEPEIKAPFSSLLPETFVPDYQQRLLLYRRLSSAQSDSELLEIESEMRERFGSLPKEAKNLLSLIEIKIRLRKHQIESLIVGKDRLTLKPTGGTSIDIARAIALAASRPQQFQILPDSRILVFSKVDSMEMLSQVVSGLFIEFGLH